MRPEIHLLGGPRISLGAESPLPIRGHKPWGVLAYLVLNRRAVTRQHLASLLFEDAEDPMAALRWNLSELRRALGPETLRGESIAFDRDLAGLVDVDVLSHGDWPQALSLPGLGHELLEGIGFAGSPSFDVWLQAERRRLQSTARAVLREAALARLATGDAAAASALAARVVGLDPLDENHQVLLVRCLSAAGDGVAAARQAAACRALFERELGIRPGPALAAALHTSTAAPTTRPAGGRAAALAQLEAGEAAIGAGVLDAGLQCLRCAIVDADAARDQVLQARARVSLGSALVHAARGSDEEGAAALHEALAIGQDASPAMGAAACRELGYIEFLRGRYARAAAWLERAAPLARGHTAEQSRIATLHGCILSDTAYFGAALEQLQHALELARSANDARQRIYAQSMIGRVHVLRCDAVTAEAVLEESVELARDGWTAFLPWPLSFRAEVDLQEGRIDLAAERLEHAFALGCHLGDPCWEGVAARGLGRVAMLRGDPENAQALLLDAVDRCSRLPDTYLWGKAYALEALTRLGVAQRLPRVGEWLDQLMTIACDAGMRAFVAHAQACRGELGDPASTAAARFLAGEIEMAALRPAAPA